MRGICKCDLCGNVYCEKENPVYDGITVWWKNNAGENKIPASASQLSTQSGDKLTDMPAVMDLCPNYFERFYNLIKMSRDENFQMNKPE